MSDESNPFGPGGGLEWVEPDGLVDFPIVEFADDLDEMVARRPGFDGYRFVKLNNGQEWGLPRIGYVEALLIPDLQLWVDALPLRTTDDSTDVEFWSWWFALGHALRPIAARMLVLNYAIDLALAFDLVGYPMLYQDEFNHSVVSILAENWPRLDVNHTPHDRVLFAN